MTGTFNILMTGGGTGGHLYPALAIAEALLKKHECRLLFVGTAHRLESRIVPGLGYPFKSVWISGLHRRRILRNLLFPLKMGVSLVQAAAIVRRMKPHVVVGTGGYASWPVLTAAVLLGRKVVIQEQNQKPGLVMRLIAPFADSVHLSFESSRAYFNRQERIHVSGNPTRGSLGSRPRPQSASHFDLDPGKNILFVFGGSQGSHRLNREILRILDRLMEIRGLQILWSAGPRWAGDVQNAVRSLGTRVRVLPYIDRMDHAYGCSDLIVCRAGATTIAEIARVGAAAVFVPFAAAAYGHQESNARAFSDAGAAELVLESEFPRDRLFEVLSALLKDRGRRRRMAQSAGKLGRPGAADAIAADILKHAGSTESSP